MTLTPTALVHEAYLRLVGSGVAAPGSRGRLGRCPGGGSRNGRPWEISSPKAVVCDTPGGQRAGGADRVPGRCRAGEVIASRLLLTGRFRLFVRRYRGTIPAGEIAWRHNLTGRFRSCGHSTGQLAARAAGAVRDALPGAR